MRKGAEVVSERQPTLRERIHRAHCNAANEFHNLGVEALDAGDETAAAVCFIARERLYQQGLKFEVEAADAEKPSEPPKRRGRPRKSRQLAVPGTELNGTGEAHAP